MRKMNRLFATLMSTALILGSVNAARFLTVNAEGSYSEEDGAEGNYEDNGYLNEKIADADDYARYRETVKRVSGERGTPNNGYIPYHPPIVTSGEDADEEVYGLEPYYNSVDEGFITTAKDQDDSGMCWAFATVAATEANLVKNKIADVSKVDLSEIQLAYFTYHPRTADDPVGGLNGDNVTYKGNYYDDGGNEWFTMMSLSQWVGLADESVAPFNDYDAESVLPAELEYDAAIYKLTNGRYTDMTQINRVKNLVKTYGAVVGSMGYYSRYYDSANHSYYGDNYNDFTEGPNHAITVVGWDDNYSKSNFKVEPPEDGAWIVKNSWGSYWGSNGLFYLSYYDEIVNDRDITAIAYICEDGDTYDNNYQYDGGQESDSFMANKGDYIANIFTAKMSSCEKLEAVDAFFISENVSYSVQVYLNPDEGDPTSGTRMLGTPVTGTTDYAGWYKIPLNDEVYLNKGDKYSVVITFESDDAYYGIDTDFIEDWWYTFDVTCHPGESFHYLASENTVFDLEQNDAVARIKAFTTDVDRKYITSVTLDRDTYYCNNTARRPGVTVKYNDKKLTLKKDYTVSYKNNVKAGTATVIVKGHGKYEGTITKSFKILPSKVVYRLYNPNSGEHFYTLSEPERNNLISVGWRNEGIGWYSSTDGDPVYRVYNKNAGDHHYTLSKAEIDNLVSLGWTYEGIAWYSPKEKLQPLYRVYNPNCTGAGSHHYTVSLPEKETLVLVGWKDEGIGWYGIN